MILHRLCKFMFTSALQCIEEKNSWCMPLCNALKSQRKMESIRVQAASLTHNPGHLNHFTSPSKWRSCFMTRWEPASGCHMPPHAHWFYRPRGVWNQEYLMDMVIAAVSGSTGFLKVRARKKRVSSHLSSSAVQKRECVPARKLFCRYTIHIGDCPLVESCCMTNSKCDV